MKWPALSPQKKLYAVCGLLLIAAVILIIDRIALRREITRLKQSIAYVALAGRDMPDVSDDIVNSLESRIEALKYRLDDLESKRRRSDDLDRRVGHLEVEAGRLDSKINDVANSPGTTISQLERQIQSLKDEINRHGKYIREIMSKVGMWLPADLLGR